jgi:ribosomal protein S6--L-glutamate ligase
MAASKVIIGNEEWCAFPSLGVPAIKARVDSGAKTSALHAFNIQRFQHENASWVSFDVHPLQNNRQVVIRCKAPVCDKRWVKSSSGLSEKRYVIKVPMQLGHFLWSIEVTLTNRDSMGYRMLLGRNAMQNHVLVDPSEGCHLGTRSTTDIEKLYHTAKSKDDGLNIAILANRADLYGNQRLLETAQERGHEIRFIDVKNTGLQFINNGTQCFIGNRLIDDLDVVIPRFPANISAYACSLLQHFQQRGAVPINSAQAIRQARDTLSTLQVLQQYQIPLSTYSFAPSAQYAQTMIAQVGCAPLLLKNLSEDSEKDFVLAKNNSAAESIIQAMQGSGLAVYAQTFYKECNKRFVRSLVMQDKVIASIEKPMTFTGQAGKKQRMIEVQLTEQENSMILKAVHAMDLTLAGVDIVRTNNGPLIFGITPNPGFEDIENTVDVNIAQLLLIAIEEKNQQKTIRKEVISSVG